MKCFQESLGKKTNRKQSETDKLVKQLQMMRVERYIQRDEAIQLNEAVDVNRTKNWRKMHTHSKLMLRIEIGKSVRSSQFSTSKIKRGNVWSPLSTVRCPVAYNLDKDPNWKQKCARLPWLVNPKNVPTGQNT